ncbi:radical SAM protein [Curvivirga sp.]|uniref:radical SAM protein n=1 Tax=Curvivirga sp. TaxID=2856848 RepID=UPI003B59DCE5
MDIDILLERILELPSTTKIIIGAAFEPMAHKGFTKLVTTLGEKGYPIQFITNGTLFTDENIEALASVPIERVGISFDGIREETYEWIRVRANWKATLEKISKFRNALKILLHNLL